VRASERTTNLKSSDIMTTRSPQLTIDDAVGKFHAVLKEELGDAPPLAPMPLETPEEAEARLFRFAEYLLGQACPDPAACADPRCRRDVLCRHFARVRAKQQSGASSHPRRTAGAEAVRYAIWVLMSAGQ
jgi:hypothetical protein